MAKPDLPILELRRIEASIIKPIYEEMVREIGREQAGRIISAAIRKDAIAQGASYAAAEDADTSLLSFHALLEQWKAGGSLEVEMLTETDTEVSYNVTRCKFAEMYRDMGLAEIGHFLSCGRDGVFCTGYDPDISLKRTQTIMQGAPHCDFRYSYKKGEGKTP